MKRIINRLKKSIPNIRKPKITNPAIRKYPDGYLKSIEKLHTVFNNFKSKDFIIKNNYYKKINNLDSRTILVKNIFKLYENISVSEKLLSEKYGAKPGKDIEAIKKRYQQAKNLQLSRNSLEKVIEFISKRKARDQPKYIEEFATIFYQLNLKKKEGLLNIQGSKFLDELINVFENKIKMQLKNTNSVKIYNSNPVYDYVHSISLDVLDFFERNRRYKDVVNVREFKKEKYSLDKYHYYTLK